MDPQKTIDYIIKMARTRKMYQVLLQAIKEDKTGSDTQRILISVMYHRQRQIYGNK